MTTERIQYFLDLAETLNYTDTAEHFFTTQSNISKQIIALEKELDLVLFLREHRTIFLTPAGKAFLPLAQKMNADYMEMLRTLIPFHKRADQILHIGSIPVMSHYNVTGMLSGFHRLYNHISLDIKEMESIHLPAALKNGSCDIICTRLFDSACSYDKIVFNHDQLTVVLPKHHPLANRTAISLAELREENFLQLDENTGQFQIFRSACINAGFEPQVGYTGNRLDSILSFVADDMGVSLLMRCSIESLHCPGIVCIPLTELIDSELVFLRLPDRKHSKACNLLWDFLSRTFLSA